MAACTSQVSSNSLLVIAVAGLRGVGPSATVPSMHHSWRLAFRTAVDCPHITAWACDVGVLYRI